MPDSFRFDPRGTMSSLRSRVFLATAVVAVLSIALAVRFVTARVNRDAESGLLRGLTEARALVEEHYAERVDTLTLMARLVADLPKLKAAVSTEDPPTVLPVAEEYRSQLHCEVLVVHDAGGRELVALGGTQGLVDGDEVERALRGVEASGFQPREGGLLQLVTVPIVIGLDPPEVLGALSLGYALDDELARRFEAVTQSEVAFFMNGRLLAASLGGVARSQLAARFEPRSEAISTVTLDDDEYVALARPLSTGDGGGLVAVILRSRSEQLELLRAFRAGVLIATVIGMVVAIGLSYAVARTVTRPLAAITDAMREMSATGDLTRKIRLGSGWNDEDATLLAKTFNALTDSIARFQREASVRERFSSLGRMSAVIAHEIRNPLMIIKASLRTLRSSRATSEERSEAADDIEHEVRRLDRMVGDVLDFAAPIRVDAAPVDIADLCREVAEASMKDEGGPAVRPRLDAMTPLVVTDRDRLRTALMNVLGNAKDAVLARFPGQAVASELPEIEIVTDLVPPDRIAIVVLDRGTGIAPEDLDRIFEPYFTSKRKGGGLGLAITKNIVESLGGAISATSQPGGPTEMRIELPVDASIARNGDRALARSHSD